MKQLFEDKIVNANKKGHKWGVIIPKVASYYHHP